jgi:hypothetical protein
MCVTCLSILAANKKNRLCQDYAIHKQFSYVCVLHAYLVCHEFLVQFEFADFFPSFCICGVPASTKLIWNIFFRIRVFKTGADPDLALQNTFQIFTKRNICLKKT